MSVSSSIDLAGGVGQGRLSCLGTRVELDLPEADRAAVDQAQDEHPPHVTHSSPRLKHHVAIGDF